MTAAKRARLFAMLLVKEHLVRFAAELRGDFSRGDSDDYYKFLRSNATHVPGSRGYPYWLAVRQIAGKP